MDSTKKIVKKLAGHSTGTAAWATNVANERGQILMSVLTASDRVGLQSMAAGLMKRYLDAGVPPPKVLYADCDCCGSGAVKTKDLFSHWSEMVISLNNRMALYATHCFWLHYRVPSNVCHFPGPSFPLYL